MGPPLRLLVPGWRELGLCLLGMDPSLSHSHLPASMEQPVSSHVLAGDLCTGNENSKVSCAPLPSLERGFGEGSLPSIMA